jgi:hypothetical protein
MLLFQFAKKGSSATTDISLHTKTSAELLNLSPVIIYLISLNVLRKLNPSQQNFRKLVQLLIIWLPALTNILLRSVGSQCQTNSFYSELYNIFECVLDSLFLCELSNFGLTLVMLIVS